MFEKEADEYEDKVYENRTEMDYYGIGNAFQEGAEFGYNKALEQSAEKFAESNRKWQEILDKANEWHKPSEILPEECSLVLAYEFEEEEPSLYYFIKSDCWEWMPRRIASLCNDQIRLWKEIVLPELKESE